VIADGRIYVQDGYDDTAQALDVSSGKTVWKAEDCYAASGAAPAVADHTVYTEAYRHFRSLDAPSGKYLWETEDDKDWNEGSAPVVTSGVVVTADHGSAVALDTETGDRRWRTDLRTDSNAPPAAGYGTVFFGTEDGTLYALDAETGGEPEDWQ
jgi:outer membrane protein assembly factor BamB